MFLLQNMKLKTQSFQLQKKKLAWRIGLKNLRKKIIGIHLHDVIENRRVYDHIKLGDGQINFKTIFRKLNPTKCQFFLIESFYSKEGEKITLNERRKEIEYVKKLSKFL